MANDGILTLNAILRAANGRANANGDRTYKLAFAFPVGFLSSVAEYLGPHIDVFWNDVQIAEDADMVTISGKPVPDADDDWVMTFAADPDDAAIFNGVSELNAAGSLRLFSRQLVMAL